MIGLGNGVGVTHLCIMMANYRTSILRQKTAVLEWKAGRVNINGISSMEAICTGKTGSIPYRVLEVDYYPAAGGEELSGCVNKDYQKIILDFGNWRDECRTEFLRCNKKIIVMSLSEWQIDAFWEFYRREGEAKMKSLLCLTAFGSEESRKEINKRLKLSIGRIPFSADAFAITGEQMPWFARLLEDEGLSF